MTFYFSEDIQQMVTYVTAMFLNAAENTVDVVHGVTLTLISRYDSLAPVKNRHQTTALFATWMYWCIETDLE